MMNHLALRIILFGLLVGSLFREPRRIVEDFFAYAYSTTFEHNLHAVEPFRLYRSKEMSSVDLTRTIHELGIKTVIDLRLGGDDDREGEPQTVHGAGAKYVHVPFRGSRTDQRESIKLLKEAYAQAEEPILVHCSSGTHRTGVASAIWLMSKGFSVERALDQLSVRFGYLAVERHFKAIVEGKPLFGELIKMYYRAYKAGGCSFDSWLAAGEGSDPSQWKCPPPQSVTAKFAPPLPSAGTVR